MGRTRILLVDDHTIVRQGLRRLLETDRELEVVGESGDGRTALDLVRDLHPDIVVMDISLPDLDGIEATQAITAEHRDVRVLILTMSSDDVAIRRSLKAGAKGYVLKDSPDIIRAIKQVARGQSFFSPAAARLLSTDYVNTGTGRQVDDNLNLLTERELQVLRLIADGQTNKSIARTLTVSVNTIETHRKHIMDKLDLHNTAEIVRFAVRKRVVA
ncbi:MAG TPA: response regulator transcription factor [Candidatus Binatia bacterium]|nr:response regulator transcription factor [Candidatus Binatia bacterium]